MTNLKKLLSKNRVSWDLRSIVVETLDDKNGPLGLSTPDGSEGLDLLNGMNLMTSYDGGRPSSRQSELAPADAVPHIS